MTSNNSLKIIMLGATGAVGGEVLKTMLTFSNLEKVTLLGRRTIPNLSNDVVNQHEIDIFNPRSYEEYMAGHSIAICTLGVGQPSKVSKEEFLKIDKLAVLDFAKSCKKAGVKHFELLASVGINSKSSSFYLRTKGELVDKLKALNFERLSVFQPSMILTPSNRYGYSQALTLAVWPLLKPLLFGSLHKYRGVKMEILGKAIAFNTQNDNLGIEMLTWDDFQSLAEVSKD